MFSIFIKVDSNLKVGVTTDQSDGKVLRSAGLMCVIEPGEPISHGSSIRMVFLLVVGLHNVIE